jgi:hypothetical protein
MITTGILLIAAYVMGALFHSPQMAEKAAAFVPPPMGGEPEADDGWPRYYYPELTDDENAAGRRIGVEPKKTSGSELMMAVCRLAHRVEELERKLAERVDHET